MDESQTTAEVAASEVFSPDDDAHTLWIKAYQGEISGEVLFGHLARRAGEDDHRRKLDLLCLLETRTKEALVPTMNRNGLPTDPDPDLVRVANDLATTVESLSWTEFLAAFEPITAQYIALYERICEFADGDDQEAAELLVAHELALREFARRELADRAEESLEPITALSHMR
jgi:hypothetical protein